MELDEELRMDFNSTHRFRFNTWNRLDGIQLGARVQVPMGKTFSLEAAANYGFLNGEISIDVSDPSNNEFMNRHSKSVNLTRAELALRYQSNDQLQLRLGYSGLSLQGVALASEQAHIPDQDSVITSDVRYSGGFFSLQYSF